MKRERDSGGMKRGREGGRACGNEKDQKNEMRKSTHVGAFVLKPEPPHTP